jgi:hypothetical protein
VWAIGHTCSTVIAGSKAEDGEARLAARSVCFLFEVLSVAFFPFCAVVLGVWVLSDGTLYFSGAAEVLVDWGASLVNTLDTTITASGITCVFSEYIPHALSSLIPVLTVAALPHACVEFSKCQLRYTASRIRSPCAVNLNESILPRFKEGSIERRARSVLRGGRHSKWMLFVSAKDIAYSLLTWKQWPSRRRITGPKGKCIWKCWNQNVKNGELM